MAMGPGRSTVGPGWVRNAMGSVANSAQAMATCRIQRPRFWHDGGWGTWRCKSLRIRRYFWIEDWVKEPKEPMKHNTPMKPMKPMKPKHKATMKPVQRKAPMKPKSEKTKPKKPTGMKLAKPVKKPMQSMSPMRRMKQQK